MRGTPATMPANHETHSTTMYNSNEGTSPNIVMRPLAMRTAHETTTVAKNACDLSAPAAGGRGGSLIEFGQAAATHSATARGVVLTKRCHHVEPGKNESGISL